MKLCLNTIADCDQALVEAQERLSPNSLDTEKAKQMLCYVEYVRLARHIAARWGEEVLANQRKSSPKRRQAFPVQKKLTNNSELLKLYLD